MDEMIARALVMVVVWSAFAFVAAFLAALIRPLIPEGRIKRILYWRLRL